MQNQEHVIQRPLKNSVEKHIQKAMKNVSKTPPKIRSTKLFLGGFLRSGGKGAPRVLPGAPPGTPGVESAKKMCQMETKCYEKVVFFEVFN